MIKVYHNNRCGKSRDTIDFLENLKLEFTIVEYLKFPLNEIELTEIIDLLHIKPIELVRVKEKIWIENYKNTNLTDKEVIKILAKNPILIERPIVINGKNAIIARPTELINEIL